MDKLIFYAFLLLLYVSLSSAYNASAYFPPSILLNDKNFVEVEHKIRVGFRLFSASSVNKDSETIQYRNLQYNNDSPNIKYPRVVANKNKLFFYGINGEDELFETTIMFSFDTNENVWKELKDTGAPSFLSQNSEEQFVGPDSNGIAYLLYNNNNVMLTFDTVNLKWNSHVFQSFVQTGYSYYTWFTATLLPDGKIVYIGGKYINGVNSTDAPMDQVSIYDTKVHAQYAMPTSGNAPGKRSYHSASLASDGRIIIYGGVSLNNNAATPALAVLDTTTTPNYSWSLPQEINPIGPVLVTPSVIVDNFMFLYVGLKQDLINSMFDKVYMLDLSTYSWTALDPVAASDNENIFASNGGSNNNDSSFNDSKKDIATLIIFLILNTSLFVLLLIGIAFYKWYQMKRNPVQSGTKSLSSA